MPSANITIASWLVKFAGKIRFYKSKVRREGFNVQSQASNSKFRNKASKTLASLFLVLLRQEVEVLSMVDIFRCRKGAERLMRASQPRSRVQFFACDSAPAHATAQRRRNRGAQMRSS